MTVAIGDGTDREFEMTTIFGDEEWGKTKAQLLDDKSEKQALEYTKEQGIKLLSTTTQREEARNMLTKKESF